MKGFLITIICFCTVQVLSAQVNGLTIKGYVDSYYAIYDNDLKAQSLQPLTGVAPRNNTFGLNIVQISMHYQAKNFRTNVGLHFGDIPIATWDNNGFQNVQEANIGIHLLKHLWLDVGFFKSHLGSESFLPKDNFLSTRTISSFCGPFYQSGAKLSYEGFQNLQVELWMVNGYNRFVDNNTAKSYGIMINYGVSSYRSILYSLIVGNESNDPNNTALRWHQTLSSEWDLNILKFGIGIDYGKENQAKFAGLVARAQLKFSPRHSLSARVEAFLDDAGVISGTFPEVGQPSPTGVYLAGLTGGYEYKPEPNSYLRFESRFLKNLNEDQYIFGNNSSRLSYVFTAGYYFDTSKFK